MGNERLLWAEVLIRGIQDLDLKDSLVENEYLFFFSAVRWFQSPLNNIGSFVWVCEVLDLDPVQIKRKAFRRSKAWNFLKEQMN